DQCINGRAHLDLLYCVLGEMIRCLSWSAGDQVERHGTRSHDGNERCRDHLSTDATDGGSWVRRRGGRILGIVPGGDDQQPRFWVGHDAASEGKELAVPRSRTAPGGCGAGATNNKGRTMILG